MVLVDSSHEDQDYPGRLLVMVGRTLQAAGLRRLIFRFGDPALNAMYSSNKTNMAATEEMAAIPRSADELRATHFSLGSKPLVVVTAGQNDSDEMWHRLQVDLLGRSSNSHRVVAEGSGHRVQDDRPDIVIAAIREVVGTSVHP